MTKWNNHSHTHTNKDTRFHPNFKKLFCTDWKESPLKTPSLTQVFEGTQETSVPISIMLPWVFLQGVSSDVEPGLSSF